MKTSEQKKIYFNKPQRLTQLIAANTTVIVAGRRTGKTDSIAAPFVLRNMQRMPGSTGGIVVPTFKDGQVTLYFEGSQIIDFYENIKVYFSTVGNQFDDDFEVVFLVMNDLGQKSLLNNKGDIIIPFSSSSIFPYRNYVVHGDTIINSECDILFNSEGYTLIAEKSSYPNERLICFYNDESKYAIIDGNGTLYEFEDIEELDAATFSCGYNEYKFDIDANEFIKIEDEEDGYHDYNEPDDYDYDRDTYYALGGDDYDRFKENGGSIDDMMDYLGY
jgi:hypothetical protein